MSMTDTLGTTIVKRLAQRAADITSGLQEHRATAIEQTFSDVALAIDALEVTRNNISALIDAGVAANHSCHAITDAALAKLKERTCPDGIFWRDGRRWLREGGSEVLLEELAPTLEANWQIRHPNAEARRRFREAADALRETARPFSGPLNTTVYHATALFAAAEAYDRAARKLDAAEKGE